MVYMDLYGNELLNIDDFWILRVPLFFRTPPTYRSCTTWNGSIGSRPPGEPGLPELRWLHAVSIGSNGPMTGGGGSPLKLP